MALVNPKKRLKRIILFYSLALILPGLFLSIMAFRGIQGEKARIENARSQRMFKISMAFFDDLRSNIDERVKSLSREPINKYEGFFDFTETHTRNEFYNDKSLVSILISQKDSSLLALRNILLFVPERFWDGILQNSSDISSLAIGLEEELENNHLVNAQLLNREVFNESHDIMLKVQALMNGARLCRKLNQNRELRTIYRDIYEYIKNEEILPFTDKIARDQMGQILIKWIQDNEFSTDISDQTIPVMEISSFLAIPQIYLKQSHYLNLIEEYETLISGINAESLPEKVDLENIHSQLNKKLQIVHSQNIYSKLADQINKKLIHSKSINDASLNNFSYYEDSVSLYTSFYSGKQNISYALTINMVELLKSFPKNRLEEAGNLSWRIIDEREQVITSSSDFNMRMDYSTFSPIDLGIWSLQLQSLEKNKLNLLFTSSEGIYIAGFIIVIIGLVFGLFLSIRGLVKENKLARLKSDFISSVSHEFKSPVTSIRQMSELLERDRIHSDERRKEYYSIMKAQSERLSHLVDNILDFARLEYKQKELKLEETDIIQLLREIIETFKIRLRYTGFEINTSFPDKLPLIFVDRESIRQVLYNLLDNAYKYSGKSKTIVVTLNKLNDEVVIIVQDFGIGIDPGEQKKIYKRYFRSQALEIKSIKGTGIGLAIVHQVVKAHKGFMELHSQPGKGSQFKIYLPIKKLQNNEKGIDNRG